MAERDEIEEEEADVSLPKILFSAVLLVAALLVEHLPFFAPDGPVAAGDAGRALVLRGAYLALYFTAYMLSGFGVLKEAIENLFHHEFFGEEFLMAVATVGAVCMGEFSEAVAVMVLFGLGEFLEDKAVDSSRKSVSDLLDIRPDKATVRRGAATEEVLAQSVRVDDIVLVKAGERIPLDGTIVAGTSLVDTSALTGESVPREVLTGDEVLAGFMNTSGLLEIRVTKEFAESTVSRVLEMVEHAQSKKAQAEKFITRFAKVYTPAVCVIALCVAVIPSLCLGGGKEVWHTWIYRALELLVVSCPCALVISVPLSFFAGIGLASHKGILIKGSNYIEMLSRAKTVVFDKTGTLTKGVFEVTAVHPVEGGMLGKDELVAVAAHAENFSNHPISRSLKKIHHCPVCEKIIVGSAEEISGHGLKCTVDGKSVLAGNVRLMEREHVAGFVPCGENDVGTVVHVAVDGTYCGHIVISDVIKEDAPAAISRLKKLGIRNTVLLTGDTQSAADDVAARIGMDTVHAGLLPQDKVYRLEELLDAAGKKEHVVFVGDGINDAPVLTRSDVGIAMGAMGSDAAIEASDVVIMDDMPSKVADAVSVAKKTMVTVWENVYFALGVKVLIMVLCATGVTNMWLAVFGDVGVTMLAVLNAMRLIGFGRRK